MDIGSILLLLALVVVVGAFVARPLRSGITRPVPTESAIEISELLAERERVLDALAELDFDNEMGKIPESLYPVQREALVKRGAAVLRLLDERLPDAEAVVEGGIEYDYDDPIEAIVAARRMARPSANTTNDTKNYYCANCGAKLQPGDKFCAGCGKKI